MFIEDSRITAVANAEINPSSPGCFYSVSSYSQPPSNVNLQSPFLSQRWSIQQRVPSPDDLGIHDRTMTFSTSDGLLTSCSLQSQPQTIMQHRSSRQREIKVIQESTNEEEDDISPLARNQSVVTSPGGSPCHSRRTSTSTSYHSKQGSFSSPMQPLPLPTPSSVTERQSTPRNFEASNPISLPRPPIQQRYKTATLNIEPVQPFIQLEESVSPVNNSRLKESTVSYTTVNLTLRSPSAGSENKRFSTPTPLTSTSGSVSVNASSSGCGSRNGRFDVMGVEQGPPLCSCGGTVRIPSQSSNTLTYSTYSNSKGGFEAQVQIQIGPNGGTITASRKRRENHSLQQMNAGKFNDEFK